MSNGLKNRKKSFFLGRLQKRYVLSFLFLACLIYLTMMLQINFFSEQLSTALHAAYPEMEASLVAQFQDNVSAFKLQVGILEGVLFIGIFSVFTLFTRSVFGPIHSLSKHLESCVRDGKLKEIHLRREDLFQDIAESINVLVKKNK